MNRTFIIPAAIALTLHAMLFVGSGKPPAPKDNKIKIAAKKDELPDAPELILLQKLEDLTQDDKVVPNPEDKAGGGNNDEPPPGNIEIPRFEGSRDPWVITQEPSKVPVGKGTKIPTNFPGFGKGDGDGPGAGIVSSAFLDNPPATRRQTPPAYPHAMKVAGITGTVWVEFVVDENGRVHDARVVKTTNDGFNEATLAAIATWRFEAGKRKGLPVRFRMTIPIVFNLDD